MKQEEVVVVEEEEEELSEGLREEAFLRQVKCIRLALNPSNSLKGLLLPTPYVTNPNPQLSEGQHIAV